MRNYDFPTIRNIADVIPFIEGADEFKVIGKGWYTVINYVVALEDTFPTIEPAGGSEKQRKERQLEAAMRRECRGLVFDYTSGELLSRPYHKFFNVNERPETHVNKINPSVPHIILEKLDGSMVRPIIVPGTSSTVCYRLGTKAGVTDVAMNAEVWVAQHPPYHNFICSTLLEGFTAIFEWCSRKNRVVVDYPEDRLVLTAIRHLETGRYLNYPEMEHRAGMFGIDLVKVVELGYDRCDQTQRLVDTIRAWEGEEGVVIRSDCGAMVKIKADAYLTLHRSKESLSGEKNIISVIVNDQVDDLIPVLTEEDQKILRSFQRAFWFQVDEVASNIVEMYLDGGVDISDQKQFAQQFVASCPRQLHQYMYGLKKGKGAKQMLIDNIAKSVGTQKAVNSARWMWGGLVWNPYAETL